MKQFIHHSRISSVLAVLVSILGSSAIAFGQMQWSSYDTSGNLVTNNVATGGDAASGTSVTLTVPANTRMFFITRSFTPIVLSQPNAAAVVTFKFSASGGITGVAQKTVEWGLYNSIGTASLADDMGMFGGWTGGTVEGLLHASGSADLFTGSSTGQGKSVTGAPTDGTTYTNQIRLFFKTAPIGVALGSSSSTLGAAGIAMNGADLTSRLYTNPGNWTNTVDEFALMFNNTTANPVTVTLSGIGLGTSLTWDAGGANPVTPTDGGGNWSTTNANWSSGVGGAIGASDSVWFPGYNAVIGANNGAAGTLTNTDAGGVTVSNITFNAAGSGSYNISGTPLILTGTPTITVAIGVSATNNAPLGGTGFTKAGNGTFVLLPSVAATNVGVTTVNAGTLFLGSAAVINLNDDLVVNAGGLVNVAGANAMNTSKTLTINGGAVTNISPTQTTMTFGRIIFDNHGSLGSLGNAGSGPQIVITNIDARSGILAYDKFSSLQTTNCTVKSTAGIYTNQCGANNSGVQGYIITALGGTIVMDYPLLRPNGGTAGRGQFMNSGALTLGGGTLLIQGNSGRSETVLGAIVQPGGSSVVMNNSGTPNMTLVQGAITRNVGGTVNYSKSATGSGSANFSTTTINVNGNLGGAITIGGNDWVIGSASGSATSISAYSAYTTTTDPSVWVAANNVSLGAVTVGTFTANTTINSLKYTATPVSDIALGGNILTLGSGGLLVTGSAAPTISGGTLQGGSGTDLIVQQYSTADLNISATLANNTTATSLTKSGPGKLIITGTDNMTGTNYLNGGTVEVSDLAKLASGPLVMNNGALRYTGSDASSSRAITVNGVGAIIDVAGGTTLTQIGAIVSGGGVNSPINSVNMGDWSGLTKIGSGTLVLAANNVYNGPTVVSNGVLSVNGTNSLTGTGGLTNYSGGGSFTVYGGTLGGTGMISGPVDIKNGGTISPGNSIGTLTLASGLTLESGSTSLFEVTNNAAGDLLVVQGNLTIQPNSTIAISVLGVSALEPSTNTLITYTGAKSGSFNPTVVVTGGSLDSSLSIDESTPGQIKLVAVPQVALTCQPQDATVSTNDPVTFNVCATGSAPIGYQWYYTPNVSTPAAPIDGATSSSYFIAHADGTNNGYYSVVVTNNYNSVTSRVASLTVGNVCSQLSGPFDQTVIQGHNATFTTMVLIGNPPPTLQWQINNVNVDGATNTSLTLTNVQYATLNNAAVCVIASNAACMVTNCATLTVIIPPVITPQLTNITVSVGDTANFVSGATGVPPPGLQWYKNGVGISGQTNGTLTINNAQGSDIAIYTLVATNAAGSATNSAKLSVASTTLAATSLAPANGATGVCYDTPLYITFNGPVSIVNSGRILIYNATNPVTPVDTIDMSSNTVVVSPTILLTNNIQPHSLFSGDSQVINYFPVIISGSTAAIYPHSGVMASNQTYYVTMDNGIVADSAGAYFVGISDTNAWRFTTRIGGPVNPTNLVVAVDGSGDFVTVQGAVDSILPGNTSYTVVNIRNGNYVEIVDISGKNNITFRGQSRTGTVVGYANNNNLTGTTAGRMAFKVNSSDIKIENLTLTNGTPQGGSQAETLLVYNNGLRCVVNSCDIKSRQDTILINANTSQAYFHYCEIYGNFDYIWGVGVGYFDHCSFHTITNSLSSSYNLTAARTLTAGAFSTNTPWVNPNGTTYSAYGFSFVNCTMEADPGVTNITLAGSNGTAGGLDSWALCRFDINAYVGPVALSNTYVFWQYSNTDLASNPISFPGLQTIGVTNNDPRLLAATNAPVWFSGWIPQSAPNIVSQPANASVSYGQSTNFSASATGIPDPSYQWYQNGQPISGATGTNLNITSAVRTNGGNYTVVVSNGSGSVTSVVATLTYIDTPPVANASSYVRPAGSPLNILIPGNLSTNWSDVDGDPLALTGGISSTNGASVGYDSTYVHYTNANDVADEIDYTIGDGFSGTAAGAISVVIGPPPTNSVAGAVVNGDGSVTLSFVGVPNYTYQVEATADLTPPAVWTTVSTNTADISGLWQFTDTQATNYTQRYYRSVYRP